MTRLTDRYAPAPEPIEPPPFAYETLQQTIDALLGWTDDDTNAKVREIVATEFAKMAWSFQLRMTNMATNNVAFELDQHAEKILRHKVKWLVRWRMEDTPDTVHEYQAMDRDDAVAEARNLEAETDTCDVEVVGL